MPILRTPWCRMPTGYPRIHFLTLLLFSLLFISTCAAQQPQWPNTGTAFAASPAEIQAAAAKVAAEPFMEATVFFERDAYSIDTVGRMTYKHTLIYRVETEDGIENWSEIRMRWFPWHQKPPEINARVIGTDGKVSILDPKTIIDGPAREDNQDTYVDDRVQKVPLPGNCGRIDCRRRGNGHGYGAVLRRRQGLHGYVFPQCSEHPGGVADR